MKAREVKEHKEELFAEGMARTGKPSSAIKISHPEVYERNPDYARVKANRLLKKPDIQSKITHKLEKMSSKSLKEIHKMITSDNEQVKLANNWKIVEHIRGKPIARNINANVNMNVEDAILD